MSEDSRSEDSVRVGRVTAQFGGFFEIEALCAALLLGIMLSAFCSGLSHSLKHHLAARRELEAQMLEGKLDYYLQRVAADLDSHRFEILPVIHPPGELRYTDGSPNPIMHSQFNSPAERSEAISSMELNIKGALYIRQSSFSGGFLTAQACSYFKTNPGSLAAVRSFLGISTDGFYELSGEARALSGAPGCYRLRLRSGKSMTVIQPGHAVPDNVTAIVPILSIYTVYLSANRQLRFLSHANEINLENQPILDLNAEYNFTLQINSWRGVSFLDARLFSQDKLLGEIARNSLLARTAKYNFLFNRL